MLKAIVFDLDNTLVNFWEFKTESCKAAATAMVNCGLDMKVESAQNLIFKIYQTQGIEYQYVFTDMLKPFKLQKDEFERIKNAAISAYLRVKDNMLRPYEGVEHMLENLQPEYKLAILTDANSIQAHKRLEFCKLKKYFQIVGTFHDTNVYKPGIEPFKKVLEKLEVDAQDAMMIGDNPSRDIRGARLVGMKTCLAKYGHNYGDDGTVADYVAQTPHDVIRIARSIK